MALTANKRRTKAAKPFCALVAALAAAAAAFLLLRPHEAGTPEEPASGVSAQTSRPRDVPAPAVRPARAQVPRPKPVLGSGAEEDDDDRTPAERALAARIEKALDDEDLDAALACADEALRCGVAEIRQDMVDALGWFGEKALPELTPFLADADEDVRASALDEWTMALSAIEDEGVRIKTVELAMGVLDNEDALEDIANEYIGADEKLAVESLARIIDGGGSEEGVAKAKETYEFVTGSEWTGAEAAERWLAEEYEPPEEAP